MRPIHRRNTRSLLRVAACAALASALTATAWSQRHNTVSFEEGEEGWYPLFDGKSLDGWTIAGDADWQARDGEIVVENGGVSLLLTDETFSDFELKVDFLAAPGTNSGIFLRVTKKELSEGVRAYELNIAPPDNAHPTGSVMHIEMGAGGATKFGAAHTVDAGESTEWRTFDLVARGDRLTVSIDGKPVSELVDPEPIAEGHLGLQHNQGKVSFRNLKIRRLKL
jgi:hypothetical protein